MQDRVDATERTDEEQAEGPSEDVNPGAATTSRMEHGPGQPSQPDKPIPPASREGGVTNRPKP
jgi:hypothetical protein